MHIEIGPVSLLGPTRVVSVRLNCKTPSIGLTETWSQFTSLVARGTRSTGQFTITALTHENGDDLTRGDQDLFIIAITLYLSFFFFFFFFLFTVLFYFIYLFLFLFHFFFSFFPI